MRSAGIVQEFAITLTEGIQHNTAAIALRKVTILTLNLSAKNSAKKPLAKRRITPGKKIFIKYSIPNL